MVISVGPFWSLLGRFHECWEVGLFDFCEATTLRTLASRVMAENFFKTFETKVGCISASSHNARMDQVRLARWVVAVLGWFDETKLCSQRFYRLCPAASWWDLSFLATPTALCQEMGSEVFHSCWVRWKCKSKRTSEYCWLLLSRCTKNLESRVLKASLWVHGPRFYLIFWKSLEWSWWFAQWVIF